MTMQADSAQAYVGENGARARGAAEQANGRQPVAIVHDYLNQRGGAERVVLELARIWPEAPLYTSLFRPGSTWPGFSAVDVRTSFLDQLPVDRGFRNLFPLYPAAFRSFGEIDADVVIASSSGWGHMARVNADALHIVYCHSPARWLYGGEHIDGFGRKALTPFIGAVRTWDRTAAQRADLYIANSFEVTRRIRRQYGIDAPVIYPPVDVHRFYPRSRGERLLIVSRLLPYKHVDVIVDAATHAGVGLDVVGTGPSLDDLRRMAGPTVEFHGRLPDRDVTRMMEDCRALCLPGKEDFGITAVEANAAGKPVIALAAGGALETLEDGVTGALFDSHARDDVLAAIRRCDEIDTRPRDIAAAAQRFSYNAFETRLVDVLRAGLRAHRRHLRLV